MSELVKKRVFQISELPLEGGQTLCNVEIGYETYGHLNAAGDNAILIAHYFTGTSHAAGRYHESDAEPGYWDVLIGPGKAIDTDKYFVVSSDSLCNLNTKNPLMTATGPASPNPATGKPYGSSFPVITIGDMVTAQKALTDSLGIKKFHAVGGPSMGSFQAMEWATRFPEMMDRVILAIPGGLSTEPFLIALLNTWMAPIYLDANFRGGDYYDHEPPTAGLTEALKLVTFTALHYKWAKRIFARRWADKEKNPLDSLNNEFSIEASLHKTALTRALIADANCFLRLAKAVQLFSVESRKERLKAKFLIIPAESDLLMFPEYSAHGAQELKSLGLSVETFALQGEGGHLDGLNDIAQAKEVVHRFLES